MDSFPASSRSSFCRLSSSRSFCSNCSSCACSSASLCDHDRKVKWIQMHPNAMCSTLCTCFAAHLPGAAKPAHVWTRQSLLAPLLRSSSAAAAGPPALGHDAPHGHSSVRLAHLHHFSQSPLSLLGLFHFALQDSSCIAAAWQELNIAKSLAHLCQFLLLQQMNLSLQLLHLAWVSKSGVR